MSLALGHHFLIKKGRKPCFELLSRKLLLPVPFRKTLSCDFLLATSLLNPLLPLLQTTSGIGRLCHLASTFKAGRLCSTLRPDASSHYSSSCLCTETFADTSQLPLPSEAHPLQTWHRLSAWLQKGSRDKCSSTGGARGSTLDAKQKEVADNGQKRGQQNTNARHQKPTESNRRYMLTHALVRTSDESTAHAQSTETSFKLSLNVRFHKKRRLITKEDVTDWSSFSSLAGVVHVTSMQLESFVKDVQQTFRMWNLHGTND